MVCGVCDGEHTTELKKNGLQDIAKSRHCTDLPFLALFIAFVTGMVGIGFYSMSEGDPDRLLYPTDSFGNTCGRKNTEITGLTTLNNGLDMTDYPNLYYVDPTNLDAPALCVNECPTAVSTCGKSVSVNNAFDSCLIGEDCPCLADGLCLDASAAGPYVDSILDANGFYPTTAGKNCPGFRYTSTSIGGYCFPSLFADELGDGAVLAADFLKDFEKIMDGADAGAEVYTDFMLVRANIAQLMVIAVGLTLVMIVLMRWIAKVIVYTIIAGAIIGMSIATYTMWSMYNAQNEYVESADAVNSTVVLLDQDVYARDAYYYFSWALVILTVLVVVICIAIRNKIRQAVGIFKETSVGLSHNPAIFIMPITTYLLLFGFLAVWTVFTVYIYTMQEAEEDRDTGYIRYRWADDASNENVTTITDFEGKPTETEAMIFMGYYVFGLLWLTQFILAAGSFVISGTLVDWYFAGPHSRGSAHPDHQPHSGVLKTIWHLTRYHVGTIAFGSLIIAIVQYIRMILTYIDNKYKDKVGCMGRFIMKCCQCCLWCLEKVLKYVNKNAYIECSIHGYGFCQSACAALGSLLSNIVLVAAVNGIGALLLLMLKLMVATGTAMIGYWMLYEDAEVKNSLYIILTVVGLLSYIIADAFTDLYGMGMDAILLCFIEDKRYNDGSAEKPYHASGFLQKFLHHVASTNNTALMDADGGGEMQEHDVQEKGVVETPIE
jgi:hypothetical protein